LLASIAVALHGLAIILARDRSVLAFSLIVAALAWLLITAWRLHRALAFERKARHARDRAGLSKDDILAYSDDAGESAALLVDEVTGLRGRPDQIVRIDNQFIPVEQKTGKIPNAPHDSHRMQLLAYLHLVSDTTSTEPDYGILRYGGEALFTVGWNASARAEVVESIQEVQRLMVEGGAERNHQREGTPMPTEFGLTHSNSTEGVHTSGFSGKARQGRITVTRSVQESWKSNGVPVSMPTP